MPFKIDVYPEKNIMKIIVHGKFMDDDTYVYISQFHQEVAKINPSETTFVVDTTDLEATTEDLVPAVKAAMALFMLTKFKEYIIIESKFLACVEQVRNAAEAVEYPASFVSEYVLNI